MADTKITALTERSVPVLSDLLCWVEDPGGTPVTRKLTASRLLGLLDPHLCTGRLTLTSATPVTVSDVTGATTLYFAPYNGNRVCLFDGTRWAGYVFTERSLALGTLTANKNYDVFLYDNSGTLTLELSAAWANDSTRTDGLSLQDGIYCKTGALTRRWLGTIRTTSTTQTEDSALKRYVFNGPMQNRVRRLLDSGVVSDSHTYAVQAWQEWHNGTNSVRIRCVVGDLSMPILDGLVTAQITGGASGPDSCIVSVGLNSTTVNVFQGAGIYALGTGQSQRIQSGGPIPLSATGWQEVVPLEFGASAGTATFAFYQLVGTVLA